MASNPSIFILGAQKCGTTSLADLLASHPQVFVPSIKETYFFCDEDRFAKGPEWFETEFYSTSTNADFSADATPFYLASRRAIDRLADYVNANARFVVILRDPVKRAYSAYWHQKRLGNEPLSFEDALATEPSRIEQARQDNARWWRHAYVRIGQYADDLDYACKSLGRDRILILTQDELSDPVSLQLRLMDHLDLKQPFPSAKPKQTNTASQPRLRWVQNLVTRKNPVKSLAQAMIPRQLRSQISRKILKGNLKAASNPPMATETAQKLAEVFAPDLEKLQKYDLPVVADWLGQSPASKS